MIIISYLDACNKTCVCKYTYVYYIMEVNKEIKSDIIMKSRKNPKSSKFDEFIMKVDLDRFG